MVHTSTSPVGLVYTLLGSLSAGSRESSGRKAYQFKQKPFTAFPRGRRCGSGQETQPRRQQEQSCTEQPCRGHGCRRRHWLRRRRRRRPRSRQAADDSEDPDGDVVGGDKFASEKSFQSDFIWILGSVGTPISSV
jgi:hypothetical protein